MIGLDTSSLIAYLSGAEGPDVEAVEWGLSQYQIFLPPVVLSEILSDPKLSKGDRELLNKLPCLSLKPGYWERAGLLRAQLKAKSFKAPLADTLIAQACLDHGIPLITRDKDFERMARLTKLWLFHQ